MIFSGKNKFRLRIVLLVILTLIMTGCPNDDNELNYIDLVPIINLEANPVKQQIKIGDTLWITSSFPETFNTLYDNSFGETIVQGADLYSLKNYDFQTRLIIKSLSNKYSKLSEQPGAITSFTILNDTGSVNVTDENGGEFKFEYDNGNYSAIIGLVAKNTGLFTFYFTPPDYLDFSSISFGYGQGGNLNQGRYKTILYIINRLSYNNIDLFNQNCQFSLDILPVPFNIYYVEKGTYTFEIIE
jgi:hypothetical protein